MFGPFTVAWQGIKAAWDIITTPRSEADENDSEPDTIGDKIREVFYEIADNTSSFPNGFDTWNFDFKSLIEDNIDIKRWWADKIKALVKDGVLTSEFIQFPTTVIETMYSVIKTELGKIKVKLLINDGGNILNKILELTKIV